MATSLLPGLFMRTDYNEVVGTSFRASLVAMAVISICFLVWFGRLVFIVGFLGLLVGLVLSRGADFLHRRGIRRWLALVALVVLTLGVFVGGGWALAPTLRKQARAVREQLPKALQAIEQRLSGAELVRQGGAPAGNGAATRQPAQRPPAPQQQPAQSNPAQSQQGTGSFIEENFGRLLGPAARMVFPVVSTLTEALSALIIVIFVAIFFASAPSRYRNGALRLVPPGKRERWKELFEEIGDAMARWMGARLMAMVAVGLVTGVTLGIIGVPSAIALGLLAGLFEFVPFFGPILASVPAIGIAMLEGPEKAIATAIAFVVIQQLEGNLLTPLLLQNRVDVPPLMTIIAIPLLVLVAGAAAVLVAEPLMALLIVVVRELWIHRIEGRDAPSQPA